MREHVCTLIPNSSVVPKFPMDLPGLNLLGISKLPFMSATENNENNSSCLGKILISKLKIIE